MALICEKCGEEHSAVLSERICVDCFGKAHDAIVNTAKLDKECPSVKRCPRCERNDFFGGELCPECVEEVSKQAKDTQSCLACGRDVDGNNVLCSDCTSRISAQIPDSSTEANVNPKLDIAPVRSLTWAAFAGAYAHRDPDTFVVQNDVRVCCEFADAMMLEFDKRFKDVK